MMCVFMIFVFFSSRRRHTRCALGLEFRRVLFRSRHPDFSGEIDRDALSSFLRFNYVPAPQSIYRDIHKLRPGHLLAVRQGGEPQIEPWWSLAAARAKGTSVPFAGSEDEAVSALEALPGDAVQKRMIADVPLGAFLSGGVDSSTVTALLQAQP